VDAQTPAKLTAAQVVEKSIAARGGLQAWQGLMIRYLLETSVDGYKETHKMVIESVLVNPKLEDALLTKPLPK